ncbi:MAG: C40 family peptidase [Vicinamibacterales bacterium]
MKLTRCNTLSVAVLALLAVGGCATSNAVPVPRPFPGAPIPGASRAGATRTSIIDHAMRLLGAPYRDGGETPAGFDCSGFTRYVFGLAQVTLPRLTQEQARVGAALSVRDSRPGDLIFFTTIAPGASHVGIVLDGNRFVHAPTSSGVVRIESFATPYWKARVVGVRRVP